MIDEKKKFREYEDKWIKIYASLSGASAKSKTLTFSELLERLLKNGKAVTGLKYVSHSFVSDPFASMRENEMMYEIKFKHSGLDLFEDSELSEGSFVSVHTSLSKNSKCIFSYSDSSGKIMKIDSEFIIIELKDVRTFKPSDKFRRKETSIITTNDIYFGKQELDNLKYISEGGKISNNNILSKIIDADLTRNNIVKDKLFSVDNHSEILKLVAQSEDIFLIHGPAGSGKTSVCANLVCDYINSDENSKILVTCHSNSALDNILKKVANRIGERDYKYLLRVGRKIKVESSLHKFCMDRKINVKRTEGGANYSYDAYSITQNLKKEILSEVRVIFCTNNNILNIYNHGVIFDLVILDEASTSPELSVLIPATFAKKIVLVGDHKQLPPTIKYLPDDSFERQELELTVFEKMIYKYPKNSVFLSKQYRMNNRLNKFPSEFFYNGNLISDDSIANRNFNFFFDKSLVFIDCDGNEEVSKTGSIFNKGQLKIMSEIIVAFNEWGIDDQFILPLCFYKSQSKRLNELINDLGIESSHVDNSQGMEKEIVIVSTVRSNSSGDLGILSDLKRLNVSLTRAKSKLIIVGNAKSLIKCNKNIFWRKFINFIKNEGLYIKNDSLSEYLNNPLPSDPTGFVNNHRMILDSSYELGENQKFNEKHHADEIMEKEIRLRRLKRKYGG